MNDMKKSEKENGVCDRLTIIGSGLGNGVHTYSIETSAEFAFVAHKQSVCL